MDEESKLVIYLVETPQGCFISDCLKISGYDYEYHHSKIEYLYFDGQQGEPTFSRNWMRIKQFPKTIEKRLGGKRTNERYELNEPDLASEKLPISIPYENRGDYSSSVIESLYSYRYDTLPDTMETVDADIQVVLKMDNYEELMFNYEAIGQFGYDRRTYAITSADLKHQLLDKMIFPEICLAHRPCSLSSKQVYDITRQYILSHIDTAVAKVTSNYDFCFTVVKVIPKIEPETVFYHDMFARTKKERGKIKTSVRSYMEREIFQMTHSQSNYQGYTAIPQITANNERELQERVDEWLETLISIINMPLQECPHCKGTGLLGDVQRVNHKVLSDICTEFVTKS